MGVHGGWTNNSRIEINLILHIQKAASKCKCAAISLQEIRLLCLSFPIYKWGWSTKFLGIQKCKPSHRSGNFSYRRLFLIKNGFQSRHCHLFSSVLVMSHYFYFLYCIIVSAHSLKLFSQHSSSYCATLGQCSATVHDSHRCSPSVKLFCV